MDSLKAAVTLMLLVVWYPGLSTAAVPADCQEAAKSANTQGARVPSYLSGRKVIGKGRASFYSAPREDCAIKGSFVIPGDLVEAYLEYGKYTYVWYINPKNDRDAEGWILSSRLFETGTGIGPKTNE